MAEVVDLTGGYSWEVMGNPKAMPRLRHFRGGWHNKAGKDMKHFKEQIGHFFPTTAHAVLFEAGVPVSVDITFYMKRPLSEFKGGRREMGNLKSSIQSAFAKRPDIDNLVKFVLDACNKLIFHDEGQVVKLTAMKLSDNEGLCGGRTIVEVTEYLN